MTTLRRAPGPRRFVTMPLPLRGGRASWTLPVDLTHAEAQRLARMLTAWCEIVKETNHERR